MKIATYCRDKSTDIPGYFLPRCHEPLEGTIQLNLRQGFGRIDVLAYEGSILNLKMPVRLTCSQNFDY